MPINPSRALEGTEIQSLTAWLDDTLPGRPGRVTITPYEQHAGNSHVLYQVRRADRRWALRVAPTEPKADTAGGYDLSREGKILDALRGSAFPHPTPRVSAATPGCPIERDLLVCDWVDGHTLVGALPPKIADPVNAERLSVSLVETLAAIHVTDIGGTVLDRGDQLGAGFLDRQFDKGREMLKHNTVRPIGHLTQFLNYLQHQRPRHWHAGLIHGDYSAMNVMVPPDHTPTVSCVLDWETATVGATLVDLGYLTARWPDPGMDPLLATFALGGSDKAGIGAIPPRSVLRDAYHATSGRSCDDLPFYEGLGMARLAVALEMRVARAHRRGQTNQATGIARLADAVIDRGQQLLGGT